MNTTALLDPCKKFSHRGSQQELIQTLGFIPQFVTSEDEEKSLKDLVETNYAFFCGWTDQGSKVTVGLDGLYKYTGDPDMYPLARYDRDGQTLFQYEYGILILVDARGQEDETKTVFDKPLWTRAD